MHLTIGRPGQQGRQDDRLQALSSSGSSDMPLVIIALEILPGGLSLSRRGSHRWDYEALSDPYCYARDHDGGGAPSVRRCEHGHERPKEE